MKTLLRSAFTTAGFAAALAATIPSVCGAQRQQLPGPDTKRVLVTAFRGDAEGGVRAANEIRDRIQGEFNIRALMPTSKRLIDTTLVNSGFKVDSALSPNDIKALANAVRGDEVIDGTVQKTATGYRLNARLFLRDPALSQPLVTNLETNNLGDAAKQVVSEYDRARKQIPDNQECENGIRNNTPMVAIAAARKGIANYPKATIARLCLGSAYAAMKATADSAGPWKDSVIAITKVVIDLDKVSRIAYQLQVDAYKQMHDTANLVSALMGYMQSDPTNATLRQQVMIELIQLGRPRDAAQIGKDLVKEYPGDMELAKLYWQALRAAKMYKESVPAGAAYASLDSTAADSNYFDRQIADLVADSAYAKAADMAGLAAARYPGNTQFLLVKAQNERRASLLPAAKATLERALAIDAKVNGVYYLLAQVSSEMGASEDAIKYAKADAVANPANKERAAALLVGMGKKAYDAANASKKPEEFRNALPFVLASDEVAPNANASFLIGVSAYQVMSASRELLTSSRSCDDFKAANELLTLVNIHMPKGGVVDPNTAKLVLGGAAQFGPFIDSSMRRLCR